MEKPLVSVYCLAYNHEKYIRSALDGFVSQKTNFNYEVFVHDDASTDNTAAIIKEYEEKYPHIIKGIYQEKNQHSQNISITDTFIFPKMQGKYVAICEGDDCWIDENKLQIQFDYLETHPEYVACVHNTYGEDFKTKQRKRLYKETVDRDLSVIDVIEDGGQSYHTSSVMYKIEFIHNRPEFFYKAGRVGDYPLAIYLCLNGKIRFINKTMSVYRLMTENSWSRVNATPEKLNVIYDNKIEMLKYVDKYSKGKYADIINKVILQNEYKKYENLNNFKILREKKYKGIWKGKSLLFRLKRKVKAYFGDLIIKLK